MGKKEKERIEREQAEDTVCDKLEAGENVDAYFRKGKNKEKKHFKEFKVKGFELVEKTVIRYENSASRVLVPRSWKKVALIKLE